MPRVSVRPLPWRLAVLLPALLAGPAAQAWSIAHPGKGGPQVHTVTSTADTGPGTLREAIVASNSAGEHRIEFDLAGACPRSIVLATQLPPLIGVATIDGFTQPGSAQNTRGDAYDAVHCVLLKGAVATGLRLVPGADSITTLRGLAFDQFSDAAVSVSGDGRAVIEGNAFGRGAPVLWSGFAGDAMRVAAAEGTRIGGGLPAQRNLIDRAAGAGIALGFGAFREVRNNLIGIGEDGHFGSGNGVGVHLFDAYGTQVTDNAIGHSIDQGILVEMPMFESRPAIGAKGGPELRNRFERNLVGYSPTPDPDGSHDAGNGRNGIRLLSGEGHQVTDNTIAYNGTDGLVALTAVGSSTFSRNRIYANAQLGIDLSPDGVDPQDEDWIADGANGTQNFPVLGLAVGTAGAATVTGALRTRGGTYVIEVFAGEACDGSGHGEGARFVGDTQVTVPGGPIPPGDRTVDFSLTVVPPADAPFGPDTVFTATASMLNAGTSEFSACLAMTQIGVFGDGFED